LTHKGLSVSHYHGKAGKTACTGQGTPGTGTGPMRAASGAAASAKSTLFILS